MLFRTSNLRSRLALCAATVALASGLVASPAEAGSRKNLWLQEDGSVVLPGNRERPQSKPGRGQPPAQLRAKVPSWPPQPATPSHNGQGRKRGHESQNVPPVPPPQSANQGNRRGKDRRYVPPSPGYVDRDHRHGGNRGYMPPPPPAHADRGRPRHGEGEYRRRRGSDRDYGHNHQRQYTEHHVYRYYYYRTSPRHYYYYYGVPQPYAYPVYYLVPYHVHTSPGYHDHGEQSNYCSDGYRQGGVYRGGAYTRGASHQAPATLIGGILGAAAGSQIGKGSGQLVAVGIGTVIGALIGSDVGRSMDERDRAYATGSFGHAMETSPTCTTITWNNQQTGNYGSVTPVQTYEPEPGRYCREFQQQVVIGGKLQDAYGTACRQPDGSWEIVAEQP